MTYKEVKELVKEKHLTLDDFPKSSSVMIQMVDGTHFFFRHAFARKLDDYIVVFTEHNGYKVYDKSELTFFAQLKDVKIKKW